MGVVEAGRINVCVGDCSLGSIVVDRLGGYRGLNEERGEEKLKGLTSVSAVNKFSL